MAGVKGRSGRKSHYDELAVAEVVNLSLKAVREYLQDPSISLREKAQVGSHFVAKIIPQHIVGQGFNNSNVIIIRGKEVTTGNPGRTIPIQVSQ